MENGLFQNRFLRLQAAPKLNDGVVPVRPPIHDLEHVSPRIPVEYEWLIGKFQFHDGFFLVKLFEIVAFSVNEQGFRVFRGISWVIQHGIVIYRFIQLADGFLVMGRVVLCNAITGETKDYKIEDRSEERRVGKEC